jgi:hypothetical protein
MLAGTSDANVPAIASMASETGGENKSPSARAAARAVAGARGGAAPAMRAPAPAIKSRNHGNEMHRAVPPNRDDGAAA